MGNTPASSKQVPDHAILDYFNKQTYLGNQYSVTKSFTVGSSETAILLLTNNYSVVGGTGIGLFQNLLKVVEETASQSIILNVYLNPTVSGAGTTLTPVNMRSAYGNNSVATVAYSPTVSPNGTLVDSISASALSVGQSNLMRVLDYGQVLLVTAIASASSTSINTILGWFEL